MEIDYTVTTDNSLIVSEGQYDNASTYIAPQVGGWGRRSTDYWPSTYMYIPYQTYITREPDVCSETCHVFGCAHATQCKCGKATRKLEPKKCACCGKKV